MHYFTQLDANKQLPKQLFWIHNNYTILIVCYVYQRNLRYCPYDAIHATCPYDTVPTIQSLRYCPYDTVE